MRWSLLALSLLALPAMGCVTPTQFYGSATVPGGAPACRSRCETQGLQFAGMVMMGEYTDGCICKAADGVGGDAAQELGAAAAAGAAAAEIEAERAEADEAAAADTDTESTTPAHGDDG